MILFDNESSLQVILVLISIQFSVGVSVIQTFVSFEYSEEVQIKGRTGRQGDNGSFCMVLDAAALEQIDMSPAEVQAMHDTGHYHTIIHAKRTKKFADDYPEKVRKLI